MKKYDCSDEVLSDYYEAHDLLEDFSLNLMAHGIEKVLGNRIDHMNKTVDSLYHSCLYALEKGGMLKKTDSIDTVLIDKGKIKSIAELSKIKSRMFELSPTIIPHVQLVLHCATHLPSVLVGKRDGLQVLFPNGGSELVSAIYSGNPLQDHVNQLLADAVIKKNSLIDKELPILEVGAGTGATTTPVLTQIAQLETPLQSHVTDISPSLVGDLQHRLGDLYPFSCYRTLDIEKGGDGNFGTIYASNVLHATSNIESVIANLTKMLAKNGRLIINELVEFSAYTTVTFGLTKGWWLSEDKQRLPHTPLLSVDGWTNILTKNGFIVSDIKYSRVKNSVFKHQAVIVSQKVS